MAGIGPWGTGCIQAGRRPRGGSTGENLQRRCGGRMCGGRRRGLGGCVSVGRRSRQQVDVEIDVPSARQEDGKTGWWVLEVLECRSAGCARPRHPWPRGRCTLPMGRKLDSMERRGGDAEGKPPGERVRARAADCSAVSAARLSHTPPTPLPACRPSSTRLPLSRLELRAVTQPALQSFR